MNFINEPYGVLIFKLLLAGFLGGLVGIERDMRGRPAGLRTHFLVSLGSALYMIISTSIPGSDPSRIAAQIVSGIGFIGAGTIMKEGLTVRGLTTASSFWVVAAVGMSVGEGGYLLAVTATVIALISLTMFKNMDSFYNRKSYRLLKLTLPLDISSEDILQNITSSNISVIYVDYNQDFINSETVLKITLRIHHKGTTDNDYSEIISNLVDGGIELRKCSWTHGRMY